MTDRLTELQEKYTEKPGEDIRNEIHEELKRVSEFTIDLDNLQPIKHVWVDRGLIMSCEGAGHPNHRHFKRKK